ncbi:MAG: FkbM family methyltransferase [bacterium]
MDIEGAELDALKGAAETIKKNRPKLAICIYHKPSDLFEIPLFIKSLVPEYRFYLRQHQPISCDLVLYAVI